MKKRVDQLEVGDLLDLEGDPIADPHRSHGEDSTDPWTFEYAEVQEIDVESRQCIGVYTTQGAFGFPHDHLVEVYER